jgi:hypothetical protein
MKNKIKLISEFVLQLVEFLTQIGTTNEGQTKVQSVKIISRSMLSTFLKRLVSFRPTMNNYLYILRDK